MMYLYICVIFTVCCPQVAKKSTASLIENKTAFIFLYIVTQWIPPL